MKNKLIYILFISLLFMQDEIGIGLHSNNLISYLQSYYTTSSTLGYANARDIMYGEIYNNNGDVACVYTNYTVSNVPTQSPRPVVHDGGLNCEHLWPQSMGASSEPMKSDMHILKPCKDNVNSYRGNKPYGESNDSQTNNWFWLTYNLTSPPSNNINEYSESASDVFEPREDVKGDIARSMFYFYTIYTSEADAESDIFFDDQKDILYQWHINDPADNNEIDITWLIAEYQNDTPNPFILDNTLVYRCYFYNESELGCDGIPNSGLEIDECGICDGTGIADGACDCDGNITDCAGTCGGGAIVDECGVCSGNNTCADLNNDNTINVTDVVALVNLIINGNPNNIGDINQDNLVNVTDIILLIDIILL